MKYTAIVFIGPESYSATNEVAEEAMRELQEKSGGKFTFRPSDGTIYEEHYAGPCGVIYRLGYRDETPTYKQVYAECLRKICNRTDGPLTSFVAIARAINLAREAGPYGGSDDPIANALDVALRSEVEPEPNPNINSSD